MNREQAVKLLPIIQAWADGKEIQVKNSFKPIKLWETFDSDHFAEFGNDQWEWRIKPEIKTGWIGIFNSEGSNYLTGIWDDRESALNSLSKYQKIACIQITYTDGEGL